MRLIASLILLLAAAVIVAGQPPQAPRKPAQAPGVCQCTGKGNCTCDSLSCFCRACSGRKGVENSDTLGVYTATFTFNHDAQAKTYETPAIARRFGFPDLKATCDQPIPAGTYRVTLTPIGTTTKAIGCNCYQQVDAPAACICTKGECTCRYGKDCRGFKPPQRYDTQTIWHDEAAGKFWRYIDHRGNWEIVPDPRPVAPQTLYAPPAFFAPSFGGGMRGGSC